MASELSVDQWQTILGNSNITKPLDISIFQALYSFEEHCAPAGEVGRLLGYDGRNTSSPLNFEVAHFAKRIAKQFDVKFSQRDDGNYQYWDFFFHGWAEGKFFVWQLKDTLVQALETLHLVNDMQFAEELPNANILHEGLRKTITVNSYERNPQARKICIQHWGTNCQVCDFDFAKAYGDIGQGFIHVHHLVPIAEIAATYEINPITDLRPVCPNCHAMLHVKNPPLTIEALKSIMTS